MQSNHLVQEKQATLKASIKFLMIGLSFRAQRRIIDSTFLCLYSPFSLGSLAFNL